VAGKHHIESKIKLIFIYFLIELCIQLNIFIFTFFRVLTNLSKSLVAITTVNGIPWYRLIFLYIKEHIFVCVFDKHRFFRISLSRSYAFTTNWSGKGKRRWKLSKGGSNNTTMFFVHIHSRNNLLMNYWHVLMYVYKKILWYFYDFGSLVVTCDGFQLHPFSTCCIWIHTWILCTHACTTVKSL
jgi:hypothetical protein